MMYVIRAHFSDESVALIEYMHEMSLRGSLPLEAQIYVVYIDTGWAAEDWSIRVQKAKEWILNKGFFFIELKSPKTLQDLVRDRHSFPNQKFQWCAGLLKGIPLLQWLDEQDSTSEAIVCIAKRQSLMRQPLAEFIEECEYHGERRVWHPLWQATDETIDRLLKQASFPLHGHRRSLECDPCVNSSVLDLTLLQENDVAKTETLENELGMPFFAPGGRFGPSCTIREAVHWALKKDLAKLSTQYPQEQFGLGCGDPFGCGL